MARIEIIADGSKWYLNDKDQRHREDGPAIIHPDGRKFYFINGIQSSEDHPCDIWPNGEKMWFLHDNIMRKNGPHMDRPNGYKIWYSDNGSTWPEL